MRIYDNMNDITNKNGDETNHKVLFLGHVLSEVYGVVSCFF